MSVRLRLTLWHTALLALVLAAFAALVYVTVSRQVESEVDHDIDRRLAVCALVEDRVPGCAARSREVDQLGVVVQDAQYPWPFVLLEHKLAQSRADA